MSSQCCYQFLIGLLARFSSEVMLMEHLCNSPVTAHCTQAATQKDPLLSKVLQYVRRGWPDNNTGGAELSPFFTES